MGKIRLVRLDSPEHEEFYLSSAETVIGRGPVLGCEDKRVSRNHGVIKLTDGSITLVANHTNPCFYKLPNQDTYAVLMKGQEKTLTFGDEFALLPDSFCYCITVKPDVDVVSNSSVDVVAELAVSNGVANGVDKTPRDVSETVAMNAMSPATVNGNENSIVDNSRENITPDLASSSANATVADNNVVPASRPTTAVSHRRNLPNWLTNLPTSSSTSKPLSKSTKRKLQKKPEGHAVNKKLKTKNVNNVAKEEDTSTIRVETEPDGMSVKMETARGSVSGGHELSDEDVTSRDTKDGYEAEYGDADSRVPAVDTGSTSAAASNQGSSTSRESCMYGKDCYRKNPQHRVDFSHPGDSDFKAAEDDDSLPECEYGTSCYRKNVQHRKDFKHTQPWKRPRPSHPPATSNVFCNSCNITYTVCTRCHRTDNETIDLTTEENDEMKEEPDSE